MELEENQLSFRFDIPLALISPSELYQNAQAYLELLKEDRRFERKSARTSPRSLGEYFSMWANTLPEGGLIAVGIEDKGAVQGCLCLSQAETMSASRLVGSTVQMRDSHRSSFLS